MWWVLKQMWDKGLIYKSLKVVPYCTRCGTPLSSHEVALGYDAAKHFAEADLFAAGARGHVVEAARLAPEAELALADVLGH